MDKRDWGKDLLLLLWRKINKHDNHYLYWLLMSFNSAKDWTTMLKTRRDATDDIITLCKMTWDCSFCITNHCSMPKHLTLRVKLHLFHRNMMSQHNDTLILTCIPLLVWFGNLLFVSACHLSLILVTIRRVFPTQVNNFLILINSEVDPCNRCTDSRIQLWKTNLMSVCKEGELWD